MLMACILIKAVWFLLIIFPLTKLIFRIVLNDPFTSLSWNISSVPVISVNFSEFFHFLSFWILSVVTVAIKMSKGNCSLLFPLKLMTSGAHDEVNFISILSFIFLGNFANVFNCFIFHVSLFSECSRLRDFYRYGRNLVSGFYVKHLWVRASSCLLSGYLPIVLNVISEPIHWQESTLVILP